MTRRIALFGHAAIRRKESMDTNELPAIGAPAPPFSLSASIGEQASLEDYRGKRHVLLAFYVLDFTGG